MTVRLSIIVPTHDGEGLDTLFVSLEGQLSDADEVLIVLDTHDSEAFVPTFAWAYVLDYNAGHHCWGHCQINHGMRHATGDYLVFIDDDDCFPDGALDTI